MGSSGQLGLGHTHTVYAPCAVPLPAGYKAIGVSCGGPLSTTSWIFTEGLYLARVPLPAVDLHSLRVACKKLLDNPGQSAALNPLRQMVAQAFSSIAVLNASFRSSQSSQSRTDGSSSAGSSSSLSGGALCVQLDEVRDAYSCLVDTAHALVLNTLGRALLQMTEHLREVPTDDPENLSGRCMCMCMCMCCDPLLSVYMCTRCGISSLFICSSLLYFFSSAVSW